jgi:hypothetical protein
VTTIFDEQSRDGHPAHLPLPAGWPQNATSPALTNAIIAKSGIAKLFGFSVTSSNVAAQFILMFDATAIPASGAVPLVAFNVAAASMLPVYYGAAGRAFDHGILLCNSTTQATLTIGAADCLFDVQYV